MKYKKDGSPISSNSTALGGGESPSLNSEEIRKLRNSLNKATEFHLATIREIHYPDDLLNQSKNKVEYRIRCEFGPRHGQEYDSVPAANLFGGNVNFSETVYSAKTQLLKGSRDAEDQYMFNHDATQVVVAFMDGAKNTPFIVGGWSNTNFETLTAKRSDGIFLKQEFNGLRMETNNDGEYILTYYGGKRNTKTKITERANTSPTTFKIDKDGVWTVDDKENQEIKIDRVGKTITITQFANVKPNETYGETDTSIPGAIVNQIIMDKAAKTVTFKVADTQATVILDGAANKITLTAGSTLIEIDGATGKISLTGALVDVGEAASALAALGPQLISWLSSHTHPYIDATGSSGTPVSKITSPPTIPPPATLLSTTVKIKA